MQSKVKTRKTTLKSKRQDFAFPLEKENFIIIGIGILTLIIGYILMAENSVDGFLPTVVAPLLLTAGYCVIIPYGILKKSKTRKVSEEGNEQTKSALSAELPNVRSSNIKKG